MDQPELTGSRRTSVSDHRIRICSLHLSLKDQRVAASKAAEWSAGQPAGDKAEFIEKVRRALYLQVRSFPMLRASLSCELLLMNTTGS